MKYKLNPSFQCQLTENGSLFLKIPDGESLIYTEQIDFLIELLHKIDGYNSISEIHSKLKNNNYDIDLEDLQLLLETFKQANILKPNIDLFELQNTDLTFEELNKYDRQIKNYVTLKNNDLLSAIEYQKNLKKSKVAIICVGGIGSYISYSLVAMGIGEVRLIDTDCIELSNTSRQMLYDEDDIGKLKVVTAAEKLKKVNPRVSIEHKNIFLTEETKDEVSQFIDGCDLIINCADHPRGKIPYIVDKISQELDIPWLIFGPFHFYKIACGPFMIPGKTKSYEELFPKSLFKENDKIKEINSRIESNIMDPYNGLAAKVASIEVVKFLTGYEDTILYNKRLIINTKDWSIQKYDVLNGEYIND